jgi:acetyl esterase
MPVDPQAQVLLDQLAAMGGKQLHEMTPDEARLMIATLHTMTGGAPPAVAHVEDRRVPVDGGAIPVRLYRPAGATPLPLVVYFHGGGWVIGSIETHDAVCRDLANAAGCAVASVDYRLAPEHRFPVAAEDCYAATRWLGAHAGELGVDAARIAVGGDSAGGNLAAVVAQLARDRGGPALAFQLLIYPATDAACDAPSHRENADGYLLTADAMTWFWGHYLGGDASLKADPRCSPLRAGDFRGLPPALVVTAEYDPLRDEGEAYGALLRDAGVPVTVSRYPGMIHGFFAMGAFLDQGRAAVADAARALRTALAA